MNRGARAYDCRRAAASFPDIWPAIYALPAEAGRVLGKKVRNLTNPCVPSFEGTPAGGGHRLPRKLLGKQHAYQARAKQAGKIVAVRLAYTDLRVNYSIRYAAPGKVKPFFRLGFSNGLTLLRENVLHVTRRDFGALLYEGSVIDLRKVDYGGFGGVGVSAGRFAAELWYEFVEKPSQQKIASVQVHGWHLLLHYRLF